MTHNIKLREEFCDAVYEGRKTFEIRNNDRGYQVGDYIKFNPIGLDKFGFLKPIEHPVLDKKYVITYILNGWGLEKDYVVFSIKECEECTSTK